MMSKNQMQLKRLSGLGRLKMCLTVMELEMLRYAEKLTLRPSAMVQEDVLALKAAGAEDGEILELNQIVGYFNYVNRLLNGLGVTTSGDTVGFYKPD